LARRSERLGCDAFTDALDARRAPLGLPLTVAALLAGGGMAAVGPGILFQAMFRAGWSGSTDRAAMLKMREMGVSPEDFGAKGDVKRLSLTFTNASPT
jgi:hypothetical protein